MKIVKVANLRIQLLFLGYFIIDIPSCNVFIEDSYSIIPRLLNFSLKIFKEMNRNFSNGVPDPSNNST